MPAQRRRQTAARLLPINPRTGLLDDEPRRDPTSSASFRVRSEGSHGRSSIDRPVWQRSGAPGPRAAPWPQGDRPAPSRAPARSDTGRIPPGLAPATCRATPPDDPGQHRSHRRGRGLRQPVGLRSRLPPGHGTVATRVPHGTRGGIDRDRPSRTMRFAAASSRARRPATPPCPTSPSGKYELSIFDTGFHWSDPIAS